VATNRPAEVTSSTSMQERISMLAFSRGNESAARWWCACQLQHNCVEDGV